MEHQADGGSNCNSAWNNGDAVKKKYCQMQHGSNALVSVEATDDNSVMEAANHSFFLSPSVTTAHKMHLTCWPTELRPSCS